MRLPAGRKNGERDHRCRLESLENRLVLDSTVVINEIHYNPPGNTDDALEWIELYNQLSTNMDISEWELEGDVNYEFPDGTIVPGRGYLVIAKSPSGLEAATGFAGALGPYSGQLSNSGGTIRLENNSGRDMNIVRFNDRGDWPLAPDGSGVTLAKIDQFGASEDAANWSFSSQVGGTPGAANTVAPRNVLINEIAAIGANPFFVELYNAGTSSVQLGGMKLKSDSGGQFTLPNLVLTSGSYVSYNAAQLGFTTIDGEKLFLYNAAETSVVDAGIADLVTRGRLPGTTTGKFFYPTAPTPGAANSFALTDQIVINEIMYQAQPQLADGNTPFAESDEEWIELYNRGGSEVDLSGWTLDDGISFTIPADTMLGGGQYLVIARDAAALAAKYPGITILGDFDGSLANSGERVRLFDAVGNPADDVTYWDSGRFSAYSDGGGSSLELRNPFADNSSPEVWAPSDEGSKSSWQTYTLQKTAIEPLPVGTVFNEFVFGLLDEGEFLIDDIEVKRISGSANGRDVQLLQNGTFQSDALGSSPASWRLLGNHFGTVVADPTNASNRVLHVRAEGPQQHVNDHVETTFVNNTSIQNGQVYEFTFRAKWLAGNRQINTRLYFTRAGFTHVLQAPTNNGTPGAQNSAFEANVGPTYEGFGHAPVYPTSGQSVTVAVEAADPDGVAQMRLFYRPDGFNWSNLAMTLGGDGVWRATIPNQSSGRVVQFYVQGTDGLGATSTFPARGEDSRALYQVNNGQNNPNPTDTLRFMLLNADRSEMFPGFNAQYMTNRFFGTTLIRNNQEVFYDVGVRMTGSRFIRPNSGYVVKLDPGHKYFGVHDVIRFDINGLNEIYMKQMINRAGGAEVSLYDDVAYLISPQHTTATLLNLARYTNLYLDEQFDNGSDGTLFELDDITFPTNPVPSPEGEKRNTGVSSPDMQYRGADPEAYRGHILIKSNRAKDDYQSIVPFSQAINLNGQALEDAIPEVMDVDLWMRHYATQAFLGNWDTYGFRRPKNLRMFVRPEDGKVIPLAWDFDLANLSDPLIFNGGETRLDEIRNRPAYLRLFWGHMLDLVNRSFNEEYIAPWRAHFGSLGAGSITNLTNRANQARNQAISTIPQVPFEITTNNGNPITIDDAVATIAGDGWIDVREIRLAGEGDPLPVRWTDSDSWEVTLPVAFGLNQLTFEAYDYEGNLIGTQVIDVTSTSTAVRVVDALRITELHFNPIADEGQNAQLFEFVELQNISNEQISLANVRFTNGIDYDFSTGNVATLNPGEYVLVVRDLASFSSRYNTAGMKIAGQYDGQLNNGGEGIDLVDEFDREVHDFSYNNSWYDQADGQGFSLTIVDPSGQIDLWDKSEGWRPSSNVHGSPGAADSGEAPNPRDIVINELMTHTDVAPGDWVEFWNTTNADINIGGWYLSDDPLDLKKYRIAPNTFILANDYLVFTEQQHFGNPGDPGVTTLFSFSELGEEVILSAARADGTFIGFREDRDFRAAANGVSFGRYVKSTGGTDLTAMILPTPGAENAGPLVSPVVINEVYYAPQDGDFEFIELKNAGSETVQLFDPAFPANTWSISDAFSYSFPAGLSLEPGKLLLIVPTDPAIYRALVGVPQDVQIIGPYTSGSLDNDGEIIRLNRPGDPEPGGFVPEIQVDSVNYNNNLPWPPEAADQGASIVRIDPSAYGNDSINWRANLHGGTPGDAPTLRVTGVFVASSQWTAEIRNQLGDPHGVAIGTQQEQFAPAPWSSVDEVSIRFNKSVIAGVNDLQVKGVNTLSHLVVDYAFDPATNTATWRLAEPLRADKLLLALGEQVTDGAGRQGVDGNWIQGLSEFPSGNGQLESDDRFFFRLDAVPGDTNRDGMVNRLDAIAMLPGLGSASGSPQYNPLWDTNGDGRITMADVRSVLFRNGSKRPFGEPSPDSSSTPLIATDTVFQRIGGGGGGSTVAFFAATTTSDAPMAAVESAGDRTDGGVSRMLASGRIPRRLVAAATDALFDAGPL